MGGVLSRHGMHNADRWDAFANGIVRDKKILPVLLAFNRTPVARKRKTMCECSLLAGTSSIEYSLWLKGICLMMCARAPVLSTETGDLSDNRTYAFRE